MGNSFVQDPSDNLDYMIDWTSLLSASETVSTSSWSIDPGITVGSSSNTTSTSVVWLTGGTLLTSYTATCRITTNQGRTYNLSFSLFIEDL